MLEVEAIFEAITHLERATEAFLKGRKSDAAYILDEGQTAAHQLGRGVLALSEAIITLDQRQFDDARNIFRRAADTASRRLLSMRNVEYSTGSMLVVRNFYSFTQAQALFLCAATRSFNASWTIIPSILHDAWKAFWMIEKLVASFNATSEVSSKAPYFSTERIVVGRPAQDTPRAQDLRPQAQVQRYTDSGIKTIWALLQLQLSLLPAHQRTLVNLTRVDIDREKGFEMLWRARQSGSLNGFAASLCLLTIVQGLDGICDIVPVTTLPYGQFEGFKNMSQDLLADLKASIPESPLWAVFEARVLAADRMPARSLSSLNSALQSGCLEIRLLALFEKGVVETLIHDYSSCKATFITCAEQSPTYACFFYYLAASATLELYRRELSDCASELADSAEGLFYQSELQARRYRALTKSPPFESYCLKRVSRWKRVKEGLKKAYNGRRVTLIDAIATSPFETMIGHWNGYKKMTPLALRDSLRSLGLSGQGVLHLYTAKEALEEQAVLSLLRAKVLYAQGHTKQAEEVLIKDILHYTPDRMDDDWALAAAAYLHATLLTHVCETSEGNLAQAYERLHQARSCRATASSPAMQVKLDFAVETLNLQREKQA